MLTDEQKLRARAIAAQLLLVAEGSEQGTVEVKFSVSKKNPKIRNARYMDWGGEWNYMPYEQGQLIVTAQRLLLPDSDARSSYVHNPVLAEKPQKLKARKERGVGSDTDPRVIQAYLMWREQIEKNGKRNWSQMQHSADSIYPKLWTPERKMNALRSAVYKYANRLRQGRVKRKHRVPVLTLIM